MDFTSARAQGLVLALGALALGGCNSTTDSGNTNPTAQSATGVWGGTDSVSGDAVTALISSTGQAVFIRGDGDQFTGTAQVSSNNLAMSVSGYPDFSATFPDGSSYGIGTLSGTVSSAASLAATLSFTTDGNSSITGDWSLTYQSLSNDGSSTGMISGDYTDSVTQSQISISTGGVLSGTNTGNGCTMNGTVSTGDSTHDIYEVSYTFSNCTGTYQALNGIELTGLATLNSNLSPAQIIMAVTGASATAKYGLVSTLNGS